LQDVDGHTRILAPRAQPQAGKWIASPVGLQRQSVNSWV
jgi:hypothetical protein